MLRIALIGDYDPGVTAHQAIPQALALSAAACGCEVALVWLATETLEAADLFPFAGFWPVPATPYRSMEGALRAIRFARESGRPLLGTCGGFQHAIIEYARDVMGIADADHEESNPGSAAPWISQLSCALVEEEETIGLLPSTRLREIYGVAEIRERYRCRFGLNPAFRERLEKGGMQVAALSNQEVRAIELPGHPFFIATLFQPERSALAGNVHPLITAFVRAAAIAQEKLEGLRDVRAAIDRIDEQIVALLATRAGHVRAAAHFKANAAAVAAPERQAAMLQVRREWASREGLDPDFIEKLYRDLIAYFIEREMEHWRSR